jgi:hypothetical protein
MTEQQMHLYQEIPVTLSISFELLFGSKQSHMSDDLRRVRWSRWLRLARKRRSTRDMACGWTDSSDCYDDDTRARCRHLRGRCWCSASSLPATVNPILSFRQGISGMACMGMMREPLGLESPEINAKEGGE